ncbi:MAG: hypothetical protein HY713_00390 [candidate division NC10 bacterium]|nr:hypothetical protein [candidate division NC10 bacterium]
MEPVEERLTALEAKVHASLAEMEQARRDRENLEAKLQALHADLRSRQHEIVTLQAERERDAVALARLRAERDEVRARVEGLLGEIAHLEAAMQGAGT